MPVNMLILPFRLSWTPVSAFAFSAFQFFQRAIHPDKQDGMVVPFKKITFSFSFISLPFKDLQPFQRLFLPLECAANAKLMECIQDGLNQSGTGKDHAGVELDQDCAGV